MVSESNVPKIYRPCNKSYLDLRYEYENLFPKLYQKEMKFLNPNEHRADCQDDKHDHSNTKQFKVVHYLNMLTSVSEKDGDLIDAIIKH